MTWGETEAFATRLPVEEAGRVREAVRQTGLSRSDLVGRALRYYLETNPDDVPALRTGEPTSDPLVKAGVLPPETEYDGIGDREL
jgi:hypothetical protein